MQRRSFLRRTTGGLGLVAASVIHGWAQAQTPRIKVGQIGVKHAHAAGKMVTMRKLRDVYEVMGVVEPDEGARRGARTSEAFRNLPFLELDELLDTPGLRAVAIETEVAELVPAAQRCVEGGLHVHLDKPAGDSFPAFERLLETAAKNGVVVQLGYMLRYNPAFQFCYRAVREGWLGSVFELHAVMSKTSDDAARREMAKFSGGAMFELGCHLIDSAVHVMGKPHRVHPFLRRTRTKWDSPERDDLADNALAVLEYPGATATVRSALMEVDGFQRRQFVVCGDQGTLEIRPLEPSQLQLTLARRQAGYDAGTHAIELPVMPGRYDGEFLDLAKIIREEKGPDFSARHDLDVHETILRAGGMSLAS